MSRTGSTLIAAFTQLNHENKMKEDQHKLSNFTESIKKRRTRYTAGKSSAKSFNQMINESQNYKTIDFHRLPFTELESKLGTNLKTGLSEEEAKLRFEKDGPNKLSQREGVHWTIKLLKQFIAPFNILLQIGGILALVTYLLNPADPSGLYLAIVLFTITVITVFFNFYQLQKAESLIQSFKNFAPPYTIVIREGKEYRMEATKLVVGDVIRVSQGQNIPADIRIVQTFGMKVNNSTLTGQPLLLSRTTISDEKNPLEAKSLAYFSTTCQQGSGKGVVYFTGDRTMIGQIAVLAANAHNEESNLSKQVLRYIFMVLVFALSLGIIFFCLGFAVGYDALTNIIFALSVILGVVPQGLLMQITIILMIAAERMGKRKVLVKNLHSIQTLGSTSCICSDKTGTLTQNIMTAAHIFYDGISVKADNMQKFGMRHKYEYDVENEAFKLLHECAIVGSAAIFDFGVPVAKINGIMANKNITEQERDKRIEKLRHDWAQQIKTMPYQNIPAINGDASEYGIIKFFQPIEDIVKTRERTPISKSADGAPAKKPFNSFDKMSHVIVDLKDGGRRLYVKGAPERVWQRSTKLFLGKKAVAKQASHLKLYDQTNLSYGREGERVLGFAYKDLPYGFIPDLQKMNYNLEELTFLGLISLQDPPRDTVPKAVMKCQSAKIKVIMVTGDQPVTALAIAKQCNIITKKTVNEYAEELGISFEEAFHMSNSVVIHGELLLKATNEDMGLPESEQGKKLGKWLQKDEIVFARTSPAQKLIIVKGCQAKEYVVAVTGDGVNDAPAIKKADIGVSMGITGTDVAKDAADMVLLNDDFSSIVMGIEEGRLVFDNLKKVVAYTMCSNIPEVFPFIFFILIKYPLPLTPVLILSIEILTDFLPAITISYEAGELDLMSRRPRRLTEHLVTAKLVASAFGEIGMLETWACLFAYFTTMQDYGFSFWELFWKATIFVVVPQQSDVYNPTDTYLGNSNLERVIKLQNRCPKDSDSFYKIIDWTAYSMMKVDLRGAAVTCTKEANGTFTIQPIFKTWEKCLFQQISPISQSPVCYTTEALKYANSACFFATVTMQIVALWTMKTRMQSILFHGYQNSYTLWGYWQQICVMILTGYCLPLNYAFGTRDIQFIHHGILALPFGLVVLSFDQIRKYLIRNLPDRPEGRYNVVYETTYY